MCGMRITVTSYAVVVTGFLYLFNTSLTLGIALFRVFTDLSHMFTQLSPIGGAIVYSVFAPLIRIDNVLIALPALLASRVTSVIAVIIAVA